MTWWKISDVWWTDGIRVLVIMTAASLIALGFMWLGSTADPRLHWEVQAARLPVMALLIFALLAMIQEMEQLGQPFVLWRAPLFLVGCVLGLVALRRLT